MDERCVRHQFEPAVDTCRNCGGLFCAECLVYSFGRNDPPYCVSCALAAAGVRSNAARAPVVSRKELKRREKERRKAEKAKKAAAKVEVTAVEIDWSVPAEPEQAGADVPDWLEDQLPEGDRVSF